MVVSHEILAPALAADVRRALSDLAGARGTRNAGVGGTREVHVVYTARDPAGALASAWQESVKQGRRWSYERFLDLAQSGRGWWFRALDLPIVLGTWAADLPAAQVHLVTVPPTSGGQEALWRRFSDALEIDPRRGRREPSRSTAPSAWWRQPCCADSTRPVAASDADHLRADRIATLLGPGGLEDRTSPKLALPPGRHAWAVAESERWRVWLRDHPVTVHGSLDDLVPPPPIRHGADPDATDPDATDPDAVPEAVLLDRALQVDRCLQRVRAPSPRHAATAGPARAGSGHGQRLRPDRSTGSTGSTGSTRVRGTTDSGLSDAGGRAGRRSSVPRCGP